MKKKPVWQDWLISACQLTLFISLLPTIFGTDKPEILTSIISTLTLAALSGAFFSLRLRFSGSVTMLTALGWLVIFFQIFFS